MAHAHTSETLSSALGSSHTVSGGWGKIHYGHIPAAVDPRGGRACSNSRPQPDAKTFGGLEEGGGRWVGRSAAGVPRGGSVGTPKYIPQKDPHDALIILNIHKWGKKNFQKKFAH